MKHYIFQCPKCGIERRTTKRIFQCPKCCYESPIDDFQEAFNDMKIIADDAQRDLRTTIDSHITADRFKDSVIKILISTNLITFVLAFSIMLIKIKM